MKIHIKNFGPISSFSFDLEKDLHVLYGKNNIGKSYAIAVVYLILKTITNYKEELIKSFLLLHTTTNQINEVKKISARAKKLVIAKNKSISIKNDFEELLKKLLTDFFLSVISESFKNTFSNFSNLKNRFSQEDFEVIISLDSFSFSIKLNSSHDLIIDNFKLLKKYSIELVNSNVNQSFFLVDGNISFYINADNIESINLELEKQLIEKAITRLDTSFSRVLNTCNDVFFLPASRSGLYEAMSIFSSIFARLSQIRHQIKDKIEIPALSEPTSDYFLNLSTIKIGAEKDVYHVFAKEIEEKILSARIEFNEENKKLEYFNEHTKLRLNLGETSSMVSEIAPIVAYLKYIINEKPIEKDKTQLINIFENFNKENKAAEKAKIIFIEEPEAHLHPEIQILLMDIFARLTKHNVKIVLTTHSNYIFNKVNNLILSKALATEKIANYHVVHTEKGSIVKEENDLTEEGMEDDNFVPIAEQLYKERLKIYENQN